MDLWIGISAKQTDSILTEVTVYVWVLPFELNIWRRQMLQKAEKVRNPWVPQLAPCWSSSLRPQSVPALSCFHCLHSVGRLLVTSGVSSLGYFNKLVTMPGTMPCFTSHTFTFIQLHEQGLWGCHFRGGKLCSAMSLSLIWALLITLLPPFGPHAALLIPLDLLCLLILESIYCSAWRKKWRPREQDGTGLVLKQPGIQDFLQRLTFQKLSLKNTWTCM